MGRCFFLDMNSFFASVEQEERAELRGVPVMVVPVEAETTCAIAASYEAKALGIKTGTPVKAARRICPDIQVVTARPPLYVQYHKGIVEVLDGVFTSVQVLSVDEMACNVNRLHTTRESEVRLAGDVKQRLYARLGENLRCSVGIAANVFLAKVASDMQKPDGLTVFEDAGWSEGFLGLHLMDLPGIGPNMLARLERHGITTVRQLCTASRGDLRRAWGSVVGERWWEMLRGSRVADYGATPSEIKKSVSHTHVLPPEFRSDAGAKQILFRLFAKCMKRLREYEQAAGGVEVWVKFKCPQTHRTYLWRKQSRKHLHTNDETAWLQILRPIVESIPAAQEGYCAIQAGIVFTNLLLCRDMNLSLFAEETGRPELAQVVDSLNVRRKGAVARANTFWTQEEAPMRIAFGQVC